VDRHAGDLAGEVVEGDVERALGAAVVGDRQAQRLAACASPSAVSSGSPTASTRNGRTASIVAAVSP
jgi:hypothetical protein